jgi:circadian clock protein KaiC
VAGASADRIATGIPGLDPIIGGGLGRGSISMVLGPHGTGKTTLAMQFLHHGAKALREPGLLITFDEPRHLLFERMGRLGLGLEEMEASGALHVLAYAPDEAERFFTEKESVADLVAEKKISRVVVDSADSLMLLKEGAAEKAKVFVALLGLLRKTGCTVLITMSAEADGGEVREPVGVAHLADSIFAIHAKREGLERKLYFEAVKARGSDHERKLFPFKLTDKGAAILQ